MTNHWTVTDIPSQAGRVAIVTGANSGLGLETSRALANAGATVVMACRDPAKGAAAAAEIARQRADAKTEVMALDLADLASVRQFAKAVGERHANIDLLVNNAGIMAIPLQRTRDGFEMQIGTNHLGHFALTGLLLDRLLATPGARVVSLASQAHRLTRSVNVEDLNFERTRYRKWDAYGKSKLANLLFMFELSRRLARSGATTIAAAAHPGYASTNLQLVGPTQQGSPWLIKASQLSNRLFGQPAAMGALPTLFACTSPDVQSGDYIGPVGWQQMAGHPVKVGCRPIAKDEKLGTQLWAKSAELTGVDYLQ